MRKATSFVLFCFKQRRFRICGEAEENPISCKREENIFGDILKETETAKIRDEPFGILSRSDFLTLPPAGRRTHSEDTGECDRNQRFRKENLSQPRLQTPWRSCGHSSTRPAHRTPALCCDFFSVKSRVFKPATAFSPPCPVSLRRFRRSPGQLSPPAAHKRPFVPSMPPVLVSVRTQRAF